MSKIFYADEDEKAVASKLITILEAKGMKIATKLEPVSDFYLAEDYHQNYYDGNGQTPYCHTYHKYFDK